MKSFAKDIVSHLNKQSCDYQIAAMKYSSTAIPQFYFKDYQNLTTLSDALEGIHFSYGYTNTAEALMVTRKTFFTSQRGNRESARDVVVLVTDGLDNIRSRKLLTEARIMDKRNMAIVPIGVGIRERDNMISLATSEQGLFFVNKFEDLENLTETFVEYMVKCRYILFRFYQQKKY